MDNERYGEDGVTAMDEQSYIRSIYIEPTYSGVLIAVEHREKKGDAEMSVIEVCEIPRNQQREGL